MSISRSWQRRIFCSASSAVLAFHHHSVTSVLKSRQGIPCWFHQLDNGTAGPAAGCGFVHPNTAVFSSLMAALNSSAVLMSLAGYISLKNSSFSSLYPIRTDLHNFQVEIFFFLDHPHQTPGLCNCQSLSSSKALFSLHCNHHPFFTHHFFSVQLVKYFTITEFSLMHPASTALDSLIAL